MSLKDEPRLICYRKSKYHIHEHDLIDVFCVKHRINYHIANWAKSSYEDGLPYFEVTANGKTYMLKKKLLVGGIKAWVRDKLGIVSIRESENELVKTANVNIIKRNSLYEVHDRQIDKLTRLYTRERVSNLIGNRTGFNYDLLDREYTALPKVTLNWLLENCSFGNYLFTSTTRNCNNYAMYLSALFSMKYNLNVLGMVNDYSGGHSYNVGLCYDKNVSPYLVFIEPQTRKFVELGSKFTNSELYTGEFGRIIWC